MAATQKLTIEIDTKGNVVGLTKAGKGIKDLEKKTQGFGTKLKSGLGTLAKWGAAAGVAFGAAGIAATTFAVKSAADVQMMRQNLDTLLGSAEKGAEVFAKLNKFAIKTPFEQPELAKASETLLSFGLNADKLMPTLQMLGDISLGNSEKFQSLSLVFGQIQSTGRLMGQDLLQLINQGFNPLQIISEKTGRSVADLKDDMSKGLITFDMVEEAFKDATTEGGRFYKGMENGSKTMTGLWSTLTDVVGITARQMIGLSETGDVIEGSLFDTIQKALPIITANLESLATAMTPVIQGGFAQLVEWGKQLLPIIINLGNQTKNGLISAFIQAKPFLEDIGNRFKELIDITMEFWMNNKDMIIPTLKFLAQVIGVVLYSAIVQFIEVNKILMQAWSFLFDSIIRPSVEWIQSTMIPAFMTFVDAVTPMILFFWEIAKMVFGWFMSTAWPIISSFLSLLQTGWSAAWALISTTLSIAWNTIKTIFSVQLAVIKGIFTAALAALKGDWSGAWNALVGMAQSVGGKLTGWASSTVDSIVGFFTSLPGRVADAISGMGDVVKNAVSGAVSSIPGGDKILDAIPGFAGGTNFAPGGPALVGEKGPEIVNLPRGSQVISNRQSERMMNGGGATYNFNISGNTVRNDADIDMIVSKTIEAFNKRTELASKGV